jgi:hypothetical protein
LKWKANAGGNNNDGESTGSVVALSIGYLPCGTANSNNTEFGVPSSHQNDAYVAKYDLNGKYAARSHQIKWNSSDDVQAGIYFLRINAGKYSMTRKSTVVR